MLGTGTPWLKLDPRQLLKPVCETRVSIFRVAVGEGSPRSCLSDLQDPCEVICAGDAVCHDFAQGGDLCFECLKQFRIVMR